MSTQPYPLSRSRPGALLALGTTALLLAALVYGVRHWTKLYSLAPDTRLMSETLAAEPEGGHGIRLSAGPLAIALLRHGLARTDLPPEVRKVSAALSAARVSLHRSAGGISPVDLGAEELAELDRVMAGRGWQRLVTIYQGETAVIGYWREPEGAGGGSICFAVKNPSILLVAAARLRADQFLILPRDREVSCSGSGVGRVQIGIVAAGSPGWGRW
ncbi:MAG: hypothetical protein EA425_15560 [Puniceicoccaceae bacterium]|nr:MAG: hypothetical protein EA425_15560 [Puniceicoccaceae bacterium]